MHCVHFVEFRVQTMLNANGNVTKITISSFRNFVVSVCEPNFYFISNSDVYESLPRNRNGFQSLLQRMSINPINQIHPIKPINSKRQHQLLTEYWPWLKSRKKKTLNRCRKSINFWMAWSECVYKEEEKNKSFFRTGDGVLVEMMMV